MPYNFVIANFRILSDQLKDFSIDDLLLVLAAMFGLTQLLCIVYKPLRSGRKEELRRNLHLQICK